MKKTFKPGKLFIAMMFVCVITVAASFFIPDLLLNGKREKSTNLIQTAPESYYVESGNAMARNTSSNLTSLEQIKLISGSWESSGRKCELNEGFLTENQAVEMARNNLNIFYDMEIFPYSATANYNNWCSWDAQLYCYTDNLFNTYSAYLWVITFTKFDNSVSHTVLMTENGVIIGATTTEADYKANTLISAYTNLSVSYIFSDDKITLLKKEAAPENTVLQSVYPDTDLSDVDFSQIYILDLVTSDGGLESYYVYQYSNDEIYGIGIAPCATEK